LAPAQDISHVYTKDMGIIVNQEDNRTDLQKRIATELADKDKKRKARQDELPDGVEDSAYIEGTTHTTRYAWVWILLIAVIVIGAVVYFLASGK
jgi:hypothetical protein